MAETPPTGNRQVARRQEAERRLLQAAAEIIAEIGPDALTLADVGKRAGYSRGLATHHFGSKGAMIQRLVDSVTAQFSESSPADRDTDSAMDQLQALITTYFRVLNNFVPINRARIALWAEAVASSAPGTRPQMIAMDADFRAAIIEPVERGIANGEFAADVHAEGFASLVLSMLRGIALQVHLGDEVDLDACRLEARRVVVSRLNPAAESPSLDRWESSGIAKRAS